MLALHILALALALLLLGCQTDYDTAPAADAGATDVPAEPTTWTLSPTPEFTIGGGVIDGDSVLFDGIEGAVFNDDGSFIVASGVAGQPQLMYFRADGQLLRTAGGSGAGPGEFSAISGMFAAGDELGVWDPNLRRLTWFNSLGQVAQVTNFRDNPGVFFGGMRFREGVSTPLALNVPDVPRPYIIWDSTGAARDTISGPPEPPDARVVLMLLRRPLPPIRTTSFNLASICLPTILHAVVSDRIAIADGRTGKVSILGSDVAEQPLLDGSEGSGRLIITADVLQRVRENVERTAEAFSGPPVTIQDPEGKPYVFPPAKPESGAIDREISRIGGPGDSLPSRWSRIVTDSDREIWLERATCFEDKPASEWTALNIRTRVVRNVLVPRNTRLLALNHERVLTVSVDALGVEYVQLQQLVPTDIARAQQAH